MNFGRIAELSRDDLDLAATLRSGQVFRWTLAGSGWWVGALGNTPLALWQHDTGRVEWRTEHPDGAVLVRRFLRLDDADLPALAQRWSRADFGFAEAWSLQPGIRLLRQAPDECFFSFLCASVAPIRRISQMLTAVATGWGELIGEIDDVPVIGFPTAARLSRASEIELRRLGLGFRARRVAEAARTLADEPEFFVRLCQLSPVCVRQELLRFHGLGEKIADCIRLFSLGQDDAVPVDVHIWRIARARYAPALQGKSLTSANYARVQAAFQEQFGPMAGWAQQILFYRAAVGTVNQNVLP